MTQQTRRPTRIRHLHAAVTAEWMLSMPARQWHIQGYRNHTVLPPSWLCAHLQVMPLACRGSLLHTDQSALSTAAAPAAATTHPRGRRTLQPGTGCHQDREHPACTPQATWQLAQTGRYSWRVFSLHSTALLCRRIQSQQCHTIQDLLQNPQQPEWCLKRVT